MRAVLSKAPGGPESLVVEEVMDPTPGPGEVVIEVKAVGVNYPDALIIADKYQFKPERPFAPGAEVAGVIDAVGEGVKGVFRGDRVVAVPGWGGMVERLKVKADSLIPIPEGMDYETAAAFIMTYGTSYYALKDRAQLQPGETLLVLGAAGGVGAAAVELGKAMGARVVAAASTNDKVEFALELGADNGLIYPSGPMDKAAQKELSGEFKLSTGRRRCGLRRGGRRLRRAGPARDGLERPLSGGRLPGGDSVPAAEPDPAEVGVGGRRLLTRRRRPRSQGPRRQHGRADAALRRG